VYLRPDACGNVRLRLGGAGGTIPYNQIRIDFGTKV
jgi:hypothetical protein